jgi:ABC-2 type transport system ATP-binding protein
MEEFDLVKFEKTKSGFLSSGEQSRLNLAKALLNEPDLILFDEPTASVDPSAAEIIRKRVKTYVREKRSAVLWTSHNMREIEEVCDRVLFISHGKILLEGSPKSLPGQYGKKDLEELFISVAREPLSLKE